MIVNLVKRRTITEAQVRKIVQQEIYFHKILEEGLWDDVKLGAKRLIGQVSSKIAGPELAGKVKKALSSMASMPDGVKEIMAMTKAAMQKTGESFNLNDELKTARELGNLNTDKVGQLLAQDLKGPVHDKAASLNQEAWEGGLTPILTEIRVGTNEIENSKSLNEAGVLGVMGLSLASFGGLVFLLRGLEKLAKFIGAERTAEVIHKAHHTLHVVEDKVIDWVIPDVVSYLVYKQMRKRGFTAQDSDGAINRPLTKEEYSQNIGHARSKVEKLMYSAFLLFLAWNGIQAALHAGFSLLGFAEGTATVIKGAEIGQAAAHISDIIELGIEEIEDSAG